MTYHDVLIWFKSNGKFSSVETEEQVQKIIEKMNDRAGAKNRGPLEFSKSGDERNFFEGIANELEADRQFRSFKKEQQDLEYQAQEKEASLEIAKTLRQAESYHESKISQLEREISSIQSQVDTTEDESEKQGLQEQVTADQAILSDLYRNRVILDSPPERFIQNVSSLEDILTSPIDPAEEQKLRQAIQQAERARIDLRRIRG